MIKRGFALLVLGLMACNGLSYTQIQDCGTPVSEPCFDVEVWGNKTVTISGDLFMLTPISSERIYKRNLQGRKTWNRAFLEAASLWNAANSEDVTVVFSNRPNSNACPSDEDVSSGNALPVNFVAFGTSFCGGQPVADEQNNPVLAVTTYVFLQDLSTHRSTLKWAAIIFSDALQNDAWDVYEGPVDDPANANGEGGLYLDFKRVATHEIGHLLTLGHVDTPDTSIMFNEPTVLTAPQADDITGINELYAAVPQAPFTPPGVVTDLPETYAAAADEAVIRGVIAPNIKPGTPTATSASLRFLFSITSIDPSDLDEGGNVKPEIEEPIKEISNSEWTFSGQAPQAVSHREPDLICGGVQYHYRAIAESTDGVNIGAQHTFRTPDCNLVDVIITGPDVIKGGSTQNFQAQPEFINAPAEVPPIDQWRTTGTNAEINNGELSVPTSLLGANITVSAEVTHEGIRRTGSKQVSVIYLDDNDRPGFGAHRYQHGSMRRGNADVTPYEAVGRQYANGEPLKNPGLQVSNFVGDVDGDKSHNLVSIYSGGIRVFSRDAGINDKGKLLYSHNLPFSVSSSILEDVNDDGQMEIIVGSENPSQPQIAVYSGADSQPLYRFNGPTESVSVQAGMHPVAYLGNNRLVVYFSGGSGNSVRGLAVYDITTGQQQWLYRIGPEILEVAVMARPGGSGYWLMPSLKSTNENITGNGLEGNPSGNVTESGRLYTIVLDDQGNEILVSPLSAGGGDNTEKGTSKHHFIQTTKGLRLAAGVQHDFLSPGESVVQLLNVDGAVEQELNLGENTGFVLAVSDVNGDGREDLALLNKETSRLIVYDLTFNGNGDKATLTQQNSGETNATSFYIAQLDQDPAMEILLWEPARLSIYDGIRLDNQHRDFNFTRQFIRSVSTGDLSQNKSAEIIVTLTSGRVYILRASFGANNPPLLSDLTLTTRVGENLTRQLQADDPDEDDMGNLIYSLADRKTPELGQVILEQDGEFTFVAEKTGEDEIIVRVSDNSAVTTALIFVTVEPGEGGITSLRNTEADRGGGGALHLSWLLTVLFMILVRFRQKP